MAIPTIDLSPFFDHSDSDGKNRAKEIINRACAEYGFFQITNHGVPVDLMARAIELSKKFFAFEDDKKAESSPRWDAPLPAGYSKQPPNSVDKNEYLLMFSPHSGFNVLPTSPPGFRDVVEEMFAYLTKAGETIVEEILNDCLGLPRDFLKQYNHDRSWDFMVALRYYPATESENNGLAEHQDGNCMTLVIQDDVGGLEVKRDGKWIPVVPAPGTIVVNISDVIQVLSNNKFKSATHRVVRSKERSRHSFAFFYSIRGDKWVEPLPQFTEEIGELPKYKGFFYKDYQAMRMKDKTHPPSNPDDVITISHYAISTS